VLIELEDVEPKEVARAFGLSVNTVHSRLRLARERLAIEVKRMRARQEGER
jgi:DNA-directed RNA polymerase specialized sigma24 family protein